MSSQRRDARPGMGLSASLGRKSRSGGGLLASSVLGASSEEELLEAVPSTRRTLAPLRPNSALGVSSSSLTAAPLPELPRTSAASVSSFDSSRSLVTTPPAHPTTPSTRSEAEADLRISSEMEAHRRFQRRSSEANSTLATEAKELREKVKELEAQLSKGKQSLDRANGEAERRERVLDALLKQARTEKFEAQKNVGRLNSQVELLKKENDKLKKAASSGSGSGSGSSSATSAAAAASHTAALKMQVDAYKQELDVKDKQIASLRYELELRSEPGRPGTAMGSRSSAILVEHDEEDDDGGFEEVLREEMESMRVAYEAKLAKLQGEIDQLKNFAARKDQDVTGLATPRR